MNIKKLSLALAIGASIALAAVPALAGTWNVGQDFNEAGTGWTYGYAPVASNGTGYTLTAPGASVANFHDNLSGFRYFLTETSANLYGDRGPMIGMNTTTYTNWIFRAASAENPDVYIMPATGTNMMGVVRWTAAVAGDYTFTGAVTSVNNGHNAQYWFVKAGADGSYTSLSANASAAYNVANAIGGTYALAAGDSIDIIVNGGYFNRACARYEMTITGGGAPVTPEPGSMLALATGLVSFGGLALRRRR